MKYAAIFVLLFSSACTYAQCPEWIKSTSGVNQFVKQAEKYFKVDMKETKHQPNTDHIWKDSTGNTWIKYTASESTGEVSRIIIRGAKSAAESLIDNIYSQLQGDCVIDKKKMYIKAKTFDLEVREEAWNPRVTSEPRLTVNISVK